MSRLCLFVFFLGIAIQFGDCENSGNNIDCTPSKPGSDKTHLSFLEKEVIKFEKKVQSLIHDGGTFSHFLEKLYDYILKHNLTEHISTIFPGTLWCGGGDIAKSKSDLGLFNDTDACCRAHDNCKYDIESDNTMGNLDNNGLFTRSACSCDHQFYNCLKKVSSLISEAIGETYFNILKPQCFQCACPSNGCQ
ncbi:Phospholipase A2 [Camponotus floridanus]|uniref:phospholipase A2 n=2 Tax=Camponotus floridanus TaxID=104421 RepID=E2ARH9_CAMFO|nr:Phospholipase A2 [Camponotus floridanus]